MTVASEIARIKTNISNAYDSAEAKGATLPEQKNSENLAECIDSISGGGSTEYFTIKFPDSIVTFNGILQEAVFLADNNWDTTPIFCVDFNNVEYLIDCNLASFCQNMGNPVIIKGLEKIKEMSGSRAFTNAFSGILEENHTEISFDNLESIGRYSAGNSLRYSNLTSVHFKKLKEMGEGCLSYFGNNNGYSVYFNAVTSSTFPNGNELNNICGDPHKNVVMHFPSNLSTVIPNQSQYPNFGGTNTTILYDLPATE